MLQSSPPACAVHSSAADKIDANRQRIGEIKSMVAEATRAGPHEHRCGLNAEFGSLFYSSLLEASVLHAASRHSRAAGMFSAIARLPVVCINVSATAEGPGAVGCIVRAVASSCGRASAAAELRRRRGAVEKCEQS